MAENEEASIAALINDQPQQDSSQTTVIVEDQVAAPATPFEGLENHLREHPYDVVAWQDLVNIAEDSGDLKLINAAYDSLLKVYPNTVGLQLTLTGLRLLQPAYVFAVYFYHRVQRCLTFSLTTVFSRNHRFKLKSRT
jgi:hypothetical protein